MTIERLSCPRILVTLVWVVTLIACFSAGTITVKATSATSPADADFENYQVASKAWFEIAVGIQEVSKDQKIESLWKMERAAIAEQTAALAFVEKYPTDPRRWIIVNKLVVWRPRYVKDWGTLSPEGKPVDIKIDVTAAEAWKQKILALRQQMATATDIPEELKQDWRNRIAAADKAKLQAEEFAAKWNAKPDAPDFVVVDPNGCEIKLSDYRGKIVVLDFWATWCGPCIEAMPHNDIVAKHYADQGVVVLCVCTMDTRSKFATWVKKNAGKYPNLIWAYDNTGTSKDGIASKLYLASSLPTQFVIDRDGRVTGTVGGYVKGDTILEAKLSEAGAMVDATIRDKGLAQIEKRRAENFAREQPIRELKKLLKQ